MSRRKTNGNKEKQRFSIKKISGRTASVLIGFTIFGGLMLDAPKAKADTNDNYNATTNSISAKSTSNTDKTNQNAVDATSQSADKMSNDSMNQDSSNTPTQGSESTATSNSTDKENVDSTTSSNENKPTDTTVTNTGQENSASNKVKLRLFAARAVNDVASADTAKPDADKPNADDIYNYYHDKGSRISKERIQRLIDYKKNLDSVTAILNLNETSYGNDWVSNAIGIGKGFGDEQIRSITDAYVDKVIGTFGERLVNDTNKKIDARIKEIETLQNQYPNSPDVKDALEKLNAAKEQVTPENVLNADKMKDVIDTLNKYVSPNAYKELAKKAEENPNGNNQALNEAKQKAQDTIDKLNNLNKAQKEAAKEAVNNATDAAGVTAASNQAIDLDGNMGNLKKSVADADTTKASGNYKNADEEAQKAYDAAVKAANAIVAKEGTDADSAAVQAALEQVKAAKDALNGDKKLEDAKQAAKDAIDKLNNLNKAQKEAAKEAVKNATDAAGVTAASDKAEALDGNMGDLKESVADVDATKASGNYKNADEEAQKAYDAAVEAANAIVAKEGTNADSTAVQAALEKVKETKAALNGDSNLANAKQAAQDVIDKLNNLNDAQKEAAKAAVKNATDAAGVTAASDNAEALDGNMGDLKESVADADTTKASGNYKNADEEAQKAYDAAVEAANAIVAKEGTDADSAAVQAALEQVKAAKDALNGDKKLEDAKQAAKDAIDKLNNLNKAQKEAAKEAVKNATDAAGVTAASDKAEALDGNMGDLKESVADADTTKASGNYKNADEEAQKAYDAAVQAANAIVAKEGTDADSAAVQAALEQVQAAKDALNGDKKLADAKQAAKDAIDKLNNLNKAQKEAAKEAVKNATDAAGVTAASDNAEALDGNMGDLKESVADADTTKASGNYKNADEEAQKAYDAAVQAANAIVAKEGTDADSAAVQAALEQVQAAKDALNGDKKLEDAKQAAKDAIDKLNNLNKAQKEAAKEAVKNATDAAGVTAASDNAEALDGNMGDLKESVADVDATKASGNYKNADEEAQKAYDAAVEAANAIVAKEGTNADSTAVQAALEKVKETKAALNGDSNLANAKQAAQDVIDKLNNLNDAQKEAAKAAVKNATDAAGVTAASDNAEALDGNMGDLKESVADADTTKASGNYKNADEEAQKAYDAAVEAANAIVAKEGTDADSAAVQAALEQVKAAKDALNGDKKLEDAKQAAKDAIDKLNNLNKAQKEAAKEAVKNATDAAGVTAASDKAEALDGNMGDLKESVADVDATKASVNYTNADEEAQKAYDAAVEAANAIVAKEGTDADSAAVQAALEKVKTAKDALNGDKKLEDAKQAAKDAIDKLNNLNKAQKEAAKEAVKNATDAAGVTAASDKAEALDGNMGDLKESVADVDATKASGNYKNADEEAQKAYDAAVEAANAIVAKEGTNADSTAVQAALEKVKETKAALNGDSNLANAKQAAQDVIDKLNNLNEAQKEAAKAAVKNATDAAGVTAASNQAIDLDGNMGNLKKSVADVDATKASGNYKNADEEAQKAYDAAVEAANAIVAKEGTNADSTAVQAALEKVKETKAALNGDSNLANAKQAAQDIIDKLNNLNDAQKEAAKAAVKNATDAAGVTAASDKAEALDGNMGDLKESVADVDATKASVNYTNADEEAQKAYDAAVEAANAIVAKEGTDADSAAVEAALEKVKTAKDALNGDKKLEDAKQAAKDAIDKLNNLNEAQKAAAKAAVNNATDAAGVTAASDKATALDGNMGNLKESVADVDTTKASVNYKNADDATQKAYDAAVEAANAIVAKEGANADSAAVQAALEQVQAAKAALNGDSNLANAKQAAKDAIDKLNNLNEAQKAAAKAAVNNATDAAGVTAASDKATALDGNMGNLKESVADVDTTKASVNYKNADEAAQKAYDAAVEAANAIVAKEGTNKDSEAVQAALEKVKVAKAALNGDSNLANAKQAAQDAIDKLNNLNDAQKEAAKAAVNNATDAAGVTAASDKATALDGNMGNLKESVADVDATKASGNYKNADEAAQKAYNAAIEAANAIVAKEGANADNAAVQAALEQVKAAKDALDGDSNLANAKQAAKDAIDKLNNLNEAQKAAAKAAVNNATDAAGVTAANDKATALDNNMGNLKESVADVDTTKASVNYKNADEKVQKAYDAAVEAANAIVAKEGTNADSAEVQAALEKVQAAKAALNGDSNLANAKQAAQDAIDKLNNLNEAQKAAAKAAVNNATDAAGVTAASDQATALDGNMGDLKESVADADTIKASVNYKNADEKVQKAYDAAVEAANAIVAKEGTNADSAEVQAALEQVKAAKAALNGDSNLANAKQAAQDAIDKLNNLNEAQKAAAKAAIEQASSLAEVSTASDKATNLDSSMGDLKKASIDSESIKNNVEYVNASADKQKAFDDAMKAASDVLNGKQADYKTVLDLIISLSNAKDNLDGAKNFNNSKQVAKDVIDNLANLNDAQKVTAKKEIDSATQENAITTAVNKAKNLDDLMIKLHAGIELAAQTRVTVRYLNASPELREAYDKVVKLSKEVVAKNGNDTNANDIQLLLQALETAQNALNGKEIVVTPDSSQSNQTDSNSDNKLKNKTANPSKATATAKNKVSTSEKLPQTGDTSDNNVSIIGATLASIAGLFGLGSLYKKKEDK